MSRFTTALATLLVAYSAVLLSACGPTPESEPAQKQAFYLPQVNPDDIDYRLVTRTPVGGFMAARIEPLNLQRFRAQLGMPDLSRVFGDVTELGKDVQGNYLSAWQQHEEQYWRIQADPTGRTVLVQSVDLQGNVSSVLDVDGDGVADIIDIVDGDSVRSTIVSERLGREIFERWLKQDNPLCKDSRIGGISVASFVCTAPSSDGNGGGAAGTDGADLANPIDELCDDTGARSVFNGATRAIYDGTRYIPDRPRRRVLLAGDDDEEVYVETDEPEPNGEPRPVPPPSEPDPGPVPPPNPYPAPVVDDTEEGNTVILADEDGNPIEVPVPDRSNPGPVDAPWNGLGGHDAWCNRTPPYTSGAESVASADHQAFGVTCEDLVGDAGGGSDCVIIGEMNEAGLMSILNPPTASTGCGAFEQPGPDGTCGTASGLERIKNNVALINSINMPGHSLCSSLVCDPSNLN